MLSTLFNSGVTTCFVIYGAWNCFEIPDVEKEEQEYCSDVVMSLKRYSKDWQWRPSYIWHRRGVLATAMCVPFKFNITLMDWKYTGYHWFKWSCAPRLVEDSIVNPTTLGIDPAGFARYHLLGRLNLSAIPHTTAAILVSTWQKLSRQKLQSRNTLDMWM